MKASELDYELPPELIAQRPLERRDESRLLVFYRGARGGGQRRLGEVPRPLPPAIHEPLADPERYQTVYAEKEGSAAAPTAGLHFTPELLARLDVERVTLHVGLDTFRPVFAHDLADHELHSERYDVAEHAWNR